jgi:hypothetical protein
MEHGIPCYLSSFAEKNITGVVYLTMRTNIEPFFEMEDSIT